MDPSGCPPNLNPDKKIIRRIPGNITRPSPKEKDGFIDLKQMSVPALKELLQRQIGILSNRFIVSKLADKGKRVSSLKEQVENELKDRDNVNKTANLLSQMTLQQLNELEWTNNVNPGHSSCKTTTREENVEDLDPLQVIATHSGVYNHEKLRIEETTDTLITKADLENICDTNESAEDRLTPIPARVTSPTPSTSSSTPSDLEVYTARICEKYDHTTGKERFKPNQLPKANTDTKEKRRTNNTEKKNSSLWEESSAAPPPPVHGDAKLLSLQESLSLQLEQTEKLKYIQMKHAAERLMRLQGSETDTHISSSIASSMAFREKQHDSDESEGEEGSDSASEEHEVYDDEPNDGPTVVFTVFN